MVVGDEGAHPQRCGVLDTFDAADAVVHGNQHVRAALFHALSNRRGQAVAVDDAVGHQIIDVARAQQAQTAHRHGAGGRAVAVVVGDDAQALLAGDGVGQQRGGGVDAQQVTRWQQARQAVVQLGGAGHAACGIQLRQQRVDAGLLQRPSGAGWGVSDCYFHSL